MRPENRRREYNTAAFVENNRRRMKRITSVVFPAILIAVIFIIVCTVDLDALF